MRFTKNILAPACIGALAAFLYISSTPVARAEVGISSYNAVRTTGAITVDGKLTESDWGRAPEAALTETNTGNPVPLSSTVKVLWDDTYLYVGFVFEDPDAWATITAEDGPIWGEEAAEVFIDPEDRGHSYYEFEINPINQKVDLFVLNQGQKHNGNYQGWIEWDYSSKLKKAVTVVGDGKKEGTADTSWTIELAIPFEDMWTAPNIPPKDGDMWRINFYRIERGSSTSTGDDWYAAFSPTLNPSFHTPWRFGKVYFTR
jgi:hypothetical protein